MVNMMYNDVYTNSLFNSSLRSVGQFDKKLMIEYKVQFSSDK